MIREVNNTFKNLLRAKGCQSIYKHMVDVCVCVWRDMRGWGSGARDSAQTLSQAWVLMLATKTVPRATARAQGVLAALLGGPDGRPSS